MIKYVKRSDLDTVKYDNCVEYSSQSNIFGFSWYLDIAADNWDVLVLDDYEAVMPIPWRKKFFIKYVYNPFWVIELGIFSKNTINEDEFLIHLFDEFKYVELRMNNHNSFSMFESYFEEKSLQYLSLNTSDADIFSAYKSDRKKDLKRAKKFDLTEKWNETPNTLVNLYRENIGKRIAKIKDEDYKKLEKIITASISNRKGELLSIYSKQDILVAAGFFSKHNKEINIVASSTDLSNRKNGANTLLIDRAIYKFRNGNNTFGFGGSSMPTIAKYFKSFGAKTKTYTLLKYNNLPWFLRLFR